MSVARSSFIFASGTFLSRISGVFRESVVGAVFGASIYMDAFVTAFRIPNLLRELLAEGALGSSFTKVYTALSVENEKKAEEVLIKTLQFVTLLSICIVGLGIIFASPLVDLMTADIAVKDMDEFRRITTSLTQLMFPFIGFASLGAVVQGVLYKRGGFFIASVAPVLFNVLSIVGALWFGKISELILPENTLHYFGGSAIFGFALGTLAGGAAQSGIQLWGIWRPVLSGKSLWPRSFPWSPEVKKIVTLMVPMMIAASAGQVNVIVNTNFSTGLETGAVTWLYFAFRLLQLPIGMFGVAIGAAVLPALARSISAAGGKVDSKASTEAVNAMDLVVWLMLPCMLLMYGSATDITRILYEAGRFTARDTEATAVAIQAYSIGLIGYGLLKVLNSYYYAVDRTRFPMYVGLVSIAANYIANYLLVQSFGHEGLAITASIVLSMNALILLLGTRADGLQINWRQVLHSLGLLAVATVLVFGIKFLYRGSLEGFSLTETWGMTSLPTTAKKIDATFRLLIDSANVIGVFGAIGLARIGKTPKDALRMLKRRPKEQ